MKTKEEKRRRKEEEEKRIKKRKEKKEKKMNDSKNGRHVYFISGHDQMMMFYIFSPAGDSIMYLVKNNCVL